MLLSGAPGSATEIAINATANGKGSFWTVNFVGMVALGIAAIVLGQLAVGCVVAHLPGHHERREGAWPLHYATWHIVFDLKSNMSLNFDVHFAWKIINMIRSAATS
ncbi:hypothetical protein F4680DRAFT_89891 [Xylaria scruposa]|nr:hypothetical protein F4680DRAFT_89891 [Xylaria scruposa]